MFDRGCEKSVGINPGLEMDNSIALIRYLVKHGYWVI
jgi:hypothetical protein